MIDRKEIIYSNEPSFPKVDRMIDERMDWARPRVMQFTENGLFSKTVMGEENTLVLKHEWEILLRLQQAGLSLQKTTPEPLLLKLSTNYSFPNVKYMDDEEYQETTTETKKAAHLLTTRLEGISMEELEDDLNKKQKLYPYFNQIIRNAIHSINLLNQNGIILPDLHHGNILLQVTEEQAQVSFVDFEHAITREEFEGNNEQREKVVAFFKQHADLPESSDGNWQSILAAQKNKLIRDIIEFFISTTLYSGYRTDEYKPSMFYYEKPENLEWEHYDPLDIRGYTEWSKEAKKRIANKDRIKAEKLGYWIRFKKGTGIMEKVDKRLKKSDKLLIAEQMEKYSDKASELANLRLFHTGSDGEYQNRLISEYMSRRWKRIQGIPVLNVIAPYLIEEICGIKIDRDVKKHLQTALDPKNCI